MTPQIRAAEEQDAAAIADIYAPYVAHTAISFESDPPSVEVMAQRIAGTLETHPWLVAVCDGRIVGYAYGSKHRDRPGYRWTTDTTVYVDSSIHQRGIGRALYSKLIDILKQQGFRSAFAEIVLPNRAFWRSSIRPTQSRPWQRIRRQTAIDRTAITVEGLYIAALQQKEL